MLNVGLFNLRKINDKRKTFVILGGSLFKKNGCNL